MRTTYVRANLERLFNRPTAMSHPGLVLDKGLREKGSSEDRAHVPLTAAAGIIPDPIYATFYEKWKQVLHALGALSIPGTVRNRMVVGLGAEAVLDNSITLHRAYGVPYIPGSAIKGLVSAYAHQRLQEDEWRKAAKETPQGEYHQALFGSTARIGAITFFDALYIPGSAKQTPNDGDRPLVQDVITPHHRAYYSGTDNAPPADWDDPVPVPFVSAIGSYLFAVQSADADAARAALAILSYALDELGIGAKTSSGYGRITLDPSKLRELVPEIFAAQYEQEQREAAERQKQKQEADLARAASKLKGFLQAIEKDSAGHLPNRMQLWRDLPEIVQQEAARTYMRKAEQVFKKNASEKPWYKELQDACASENSEQL